MVTTTEAMTDAGRIRIGWVIRTSADVWLRNFNPFGLMALVTLTPAFLLELLLEGYEVHMAVGTFVSILCNVILGAAVTVGTYRHLRSERPQLLYCLRRAMGSNRVVLQVGLVSYVLQLLGFLALIVPGLLAATLLFVAIPVAAFEDKKLFGSLSRSADLTKGNRWRVLGIVLILASAVLLLTLLLALVVGMLPNNGAAQLLTGLASWIYLLIQGLLISTLAAVTYFALRQANEGFEVDDLVAVFD